MDEFYLPEEMAEWIGLKKSEYLCRLIENVTSDDIQFEDYSRYDDLIPATISSPDWNSEFQEDGHRVRVYSRSYPEQDTYHQVVIGVLIPDQESKDVFVPIITYVTKKEALLKLFASGKVARPLLN